MGSPNFYTGTAGLNVAIDESFFNSPEMQDDEDACSEYQQSEYIGEIHDDMQDFIRSLPTLFFHKVELDHGYHSGFQVYVDTAYHNLDDYIAGVVSNWDRYKEFSDLNGYDVELEDCPYFRSNIKNITVFNLKCAINAEFKLLNNLLLEKAKALGIGEVVGYSWTSHVKYPVISKKFS